MSLGWELLIRMLEIFQILIVIRVLMSWVVSPTSRNPLVEGVRRVTDAVLEPLGRLIPPMGGFDITPMIAILLLSLIRNALISFLSPY